MLVGAAQNVGREGGQGHALNRRGRPRAEEAVLQPGACRRVLQVRRDRARASCHPADAVFIYCSTTSSISALQPFCLNGLDWSGRWRVKIYNCSTRQTSRRRRSAQTSGVCYFHAKKEKTAKSLQSSRETDLESDFLAPTSSTKASKTESDNGQRSGFGDVVSSHHGNVVEGNYSGALSPVDFERR